MARSLFHLSLTLAALQGAPSDAPRDVVARVETDVEAGRGAAAAAEWIERSARDSADGVALLGLATLARLTYEYAKADSLYARLLAREGERADAIAAHARFGWALALRARGLQARADATFEHAVEDARGADERALEAEALLWNALVRARTRGPDSARSLLDRASTLISNSDARLRALYHCASAELAVLASESAAHDAELGADLALRAGDRRTRATCLHHLAGDLARTGQDDSALVVYAQAIDIRRSSRDRSGLAQSLQWRGYLLRSRGFYGDAFPDLLEAVSHGEASGNLSAKAFALANLAGMSLRIGDLDSGARYSAEAARIFERVGDRYGLAISYGLVGEHALAADDRDAAREAYKHTLALSESLGYGPAIISTHIRLAHMAFPAGDWDTAERHLALARKVSRERGSGGYQDALPYQFALLSLARGDAASAASALEGGLAALSDRQSDLRYRFGARLAEAYARMGDGDAARVKLTAAYDALDAWRRTLDEGGLRLHAFQLSDDPSDPDLGVATVLASLASAGQVRAAFELAERRRARELLDQLLRADALRVGAVSAGTHRDSLRLADASRLDDLVSAFPDDRTALLEFVTGRGGEPTTLFVVTRAGISAHAVPAVDSLTARIDRLVVLTESALDARALARRITSAILDAALATLPASITSLVIVPDGALHHIPFDALVTEDGRFLVERFAVSLAPSATVIVRLWQRERIAGEIRALVLADPAFESSSDGRASREGGGASSAALAAVEELPRLSASADEARTVKRYVGAVTLLSREEASEARLKAEAGVPYRVLHFATHALVNDWTLARTALVLAPGGGEDGLVSPGEVLHLDLRPDLVVLSACRTARGKLVGGEGVQGLTSAFLRSGARSIVATTWPIADRRSARLVESFYRELAAGRAVGDALHEAKRRALEDGRPPVEWAAFAVVGDPTVRLSLPPRAAKRWPRVAAGSAATLLLIGILYRLRARTGTPARRT